MPSPPPAPGTGISSAASARRKLCALFGLVRGQLPPGGEHGAAEGAGVARLPRQVVHLHVLDEVALVADGLEAELTLVAGARRELIAVHLDKDVRLPKL